MAFVALVIVISLFGSDPVDNKPYTSLPVRDAHTAERRLINPLNTDNRHRPAVVNPLNSDDANETAEVDVIKLPEEIAKKPNAKAKRTNGTGTTPRVEARHLAYIKLHKTGSSTIQNLFMRFGDSRNLTFILGRKTNNDCGSGHHCISFTHSINDENILPQPEDRTFDIIASHVIYNRKQFRHYLPMDTKYLSLVREPVRRQASAISYFELESFVGGNLSMYAKDPFKYNHFMLNNRMAFEFGFDRAWFPNATQTRLEKDVKQEVLAYIDKIFNDFDLIMINEQLDESLVLMKRLLGWGTREIIYHGKLVKSHADFAPEDEPNVKKYLYLDYLLYERAATELQAKLDAAGPDFLDEVQAFQEVNKIVNTVCDAGLLEGKTVVVTATRWDGGFTVTKGFCDALFRMEIPYTAYIRQRQYGNLPTL